MYFIFHKKMGGWVSFWKSLLIKTLLIFSAENIVLAQHLPHCNRAICFQTWGVSTNNTDIAYAQGLLILCGHLYFILIRKREALSSLFYFLFFFHKQCIQDMKLPITNNNQPILSYCAQCTHLDAVETLMSANVNLK